MDDRGRSIAVMQPYIFPYLGYFQLINAVDEFVFYDDVNYIKGGWINRNNVLIDKEEKLFTLPIDKSSSNKLICDTFIHRALYEKWKKKFLRSLEQSYKKAPYFDDTFTLVKNVLSTSNDNLSQLALKSAVSVTRFLEIKTNFASSSVTNFNSRHLSAQSRVIDIVKKNKAKVYINAIGGKELYDKSDFKASGIDLLFLNPSIKPYKQFDNHFVPGLSIIDVLMFNSKEECRMLIKNYQLE
jgi:hypothetical protein